MKRAPKTPALAKLAMLLLFAIATVAILDTTSISAQELGRTITSPFGVANPYMNASDASGSGSDGDTFVDPETGEVGHIIRNPFGVANPEGVDTGIDIPDDAGEEVGGIITSPFGVPASDDIDTGVDVFDEDEEYLISLPDDEESDAEDSEDVDEVDDETSDDGKELEEESAGTTTEKVLPVIDNPIPRIEGPTGYFYLEGISGEFSVTSDQSQNGSVPTLYVLKNANCTITAYGEFSSGNMLWLIKKANSTFVNLSDQTGSDTYNFTADTVPYGRTYMVLCRTTGDDPQECAIRISIVDGIKVFDPKLEGFTAPQYTVNPEIRKIAICNSQNLVVDTCSVANNGNFSWNGRWGKNINGTDTEHKGKYADPGKYSFRVIKNNIVTSENVLSVFIVRLGVQAIKFIDSIPYQYHKTTMLNNTNYSVDTSNSSTYNWRISALDFLKPNDEARPRTEAKKARPPVGECFDDTNNSGEYEAGEDGEAGENFYDLDGNDAYSSTLRQTNFPNHISNGQQDTSNYNHPAVYVRESKIKIELTMGITAISDITGDSVPSNLVVVNDYPIHIIAKFKNKDMNYVGYSTSDNGMICSNFGIITLEADQDSRLADTVGYSEEEITFSFAYEDVDACTEENKENYEEKENWVSIPGTQTTKHLIYRLGGAPTPAPDSKDDIFLKIIDKSCQWANGKKIQSDIFGAIWSNLWTPINGTGEDARPDNANGFKGVGDPVETERPDMWGGHPKCFTYQHTADAGYYVTDMLDNNSGRCEAWARFLIAFTRIHGLYVEKVRMPPMKWMFEGADHIKHFVDYAEAERYLNDNKRYDGTSAIIGDKWYKPFGIWVDPDGQANPSFHNPPAVDNSTMVSPHLRALFGCIKRPDIIFTDHVFVKYDNKYYDPSYRHIYNIGFDTINALCDTSVTYFIYGEMYEYSYIFPLLPILGEGFSQQSNPKVLYHGGGNRTGTEINYYNINYYKEQANDSFTAEMEEL